jgi:ABC-type enterobactin transport system permease subunit
VWFVLVGVAAVVLAGGVGDIGLYLLGKPTVTDYLREHMGVFWTAAGLMAAFLVLLALHLLKLMPWN